MRRADPFLEVTYRHGKPWAAYLFLSRPRALRPAKSRPMGHGMVVDLARDGTPLGIEITAPLLLTLPILNALLRELGVTSVRKSDVAPLLAA